MPVVITDKPRLLGAWVALSTSPARVFRDKPRLCGSWVGLSGTSRVVSDKPRVLGSWVVLSTVPRVTRDKPRLVGSWVAISGSFGPLTERVTLGKPYLLGTWVCISSEAVMDFDDVNRMTASTWRGTDNTRQSDAAQLLRNQRYMAYWFNQDHEPTTGVHATRPLSSFAGWESKSGFTATEAPVTLGTSQVQRLGTADGSSVHLVRASVGRSLTGIMEVVPAFGGSASFDSVAVVTKIVPRGDL